MSICPRCGTAFECGMADAAASGEPCWCTRLPSLPSNAYWPTGDAPANSQCFCPHCLQALATATASAKSDDR